MGTLKRILPVIFSDLFFTSFFLYLAAVRIDLTLEGIISRTFPLNILLLVFLLSGIAAVLFPSPQKPLAKQRLPIRMWVYAVLIALFVGSIVAEDLYDFSSAALLMGVAAGFVVFLVSFAIIRTDYE